jgi:segregation and condensation protein B
VTDPLALPPEAPLTTEAPVATAPAEPPTDSIPLAPAVTAEAAPAASAPMEPMEEAAPAEEATATADETADPATPDEAPASAETPDEPPLAADLPPAEARAALEALLFVANKPLTLERLAECLPGTAAAYIDGLLAGLADRYDHERRGWELRRIANGWQLLTRRELYAWARQLERKELPTRLSKSALETLAIIAYKQPLTRGAVEDIRGVQCGPVIRQLMDLRLVAVTGRDEHALGRPLLYGTTDAFLQRFGLAGIGDLPKAHEFGA